MTVGVTCPVQSEHQQKQVLSLKRLPVPRPRAVCSPAVGVGLLRVGTDAGTTSFGASGSYSAA